MFMVRWFLSDKSKNSPSNPDSKGFGHSLMTKAQSNPNSAGPGPGTMTTMPFNSKQSELNDINIPMPGGAMNIILGYAECDNTVEEKGTVSLVSNLFNSVKTKRLTDLKTLLLASVDGRPDEVKALLKKDSSLLEENELVTVTSLTGYQFCMRPFEAAWSVDDTEIAQEMRDFFADKKEADRQYEAQHPKGWQQAEEEKWKPIFQQRDKLICAIRDIKEAGLWPFLKFQAKVKSS